jgi:hypothetical protein
VRFGTWKVRSLYRAGSLTAAARELARYKLDLVGVQKVRWDKGGTVRAGDYNFFLKKRKWKSSIGKRILCTPQNSREPTTGNERLNQDNNDNGDTIANVAT